MKLTLSFEHAAFDSLTSVKASSKKLANYNTPHILRKKMPFWKPIFFTFLKIISSPILVKQFTCEWRFETSYLILVGNFLKWIRHEFFKTYIISVKNGSLGGVFYCIFLYLSTISFTYIDTLVSIRFGTY